MSGFHYELEPVLKSDSEHSSDSCDEDSKIEMFSMEVSASNKSDVVCSILNSTTLLSPSMAVGVKGFPCVSVEDCSPSPSGEEQMLDSAVPTALKPKKECVADNMSISRPTQRRSLCPNFDLDDDDDEEEG
jgi:hypothetical protein